MDEECPMCVAGIPASHKVYVPEVDNDHLPTGRVIVMGANTYGRMVAVGMLSKLHLEEMTDVIEEEPPKSANQRRREQLAKLPKNRKKMRY